MTLPVMCGLVLNAVIWILLTGAASAPTTAATAAASVWLRMLVICGRWNVPQFIAGCIIFLGGTLSALDGRGPEDLHIDRLIRRASIDETAEVILALSATVDGQTTAHYIGEKLTNLSLEITRLAHGMPVGGELDYLDDGTLAQALKARAKLEL